ncbi:MAG: TerB family tellurite resistance protein [Thermodesulfobacteriota bacterium]
MLRNIQRFFDTRISSPTGVTNQAATDSSLQRATAALLIEITKADQSIKEEERLMVTSAVQRTFNLTPEETSELIALAEEEVRGAVSLFQFTHLIDKGFPYEKKQHIVELLWHVVFADAEMEKHEEYLVRRIANLLHVSHRDFIEAKLKVREESRQKS